jgi:hypothetical protein
VSTKHGDSLADDTLTATLEWHFRPLFEVS